MCLLLLPQDELSAHMRVTTIIYSHRLILLMVTGVTKVTVVNVFITLATGRTIHSHDGYDHNLQPKLILPMVTSVTKVTVVNVFITLATGRTIHSQDSYNHNLQP
jgi:hypothetical protein